MTKYVAYPKWLYHATEDARIVDDEDAHKALGKGWHDEPVTVDETMPDQVYDIATDEVKPRRGRPPKPRASDEGL